MPLGNDNFRYVNNVLGVGDPKGGLWFIGIEDGETYGDKIVERCKDCCTKGEAFAEFQEDPPTYAVATTTAKIVTGLMFPDADGDWKKYCKCTMWRAGSKVCNGNIFPLGRPHRNVWPKSYEGLFGLSEEEYKSHYENVKRNKKRSDLFIALRQDCKPQAIVCYGKKFWSEFEELFVQDKSSPFESHELKIRMYEKDRVILTCHFSRPFWVSKRVIASVVDTLKKWNLQFTKSPDHSITE